MKQYNDINTKENVELKPEKKQRSYDVSSELGIKQEPIKSSREYDINKDSKKKSRMKIPIILFIIIILLFSASAALVYFGYIDMNFMLDNNTSHANTEDAGVSEPEPSNDDDDLEIRPYDDMFTFIDGSEVLVLSTDETLIFKSNPSNSGNGISVEFVIKDATTGEYYCDDTISGDGSFEWKPSDYIHDTNVEHVIGISQKAFKSDDLSTSIGSYYSTITIKLTD